MCMQRAVLSKSSKACFALERFLSSVNTKNMDMPHKTNFSSFRDGSGNADRVFDVVCPAK